MACCLYSVRFPRILYQGRWTYEFTNSTNWTKYPEERTRKQRIEGRIGFDDTARCSMKISTDPHTTASSPTLPTGTSPLSLSRSPNTDRGTPGTDSQHINRRNSYFVTAYPPSRPNYSASSTPMPLLDRPGIGTRPLHTHHLSRVQLVVRARPVQTPTLRTSSFGSTTSEKRGRSRGLLIQQATVRASRS